MTGRCRRCVLLGAALLAFGAAPALAPALAEDSRSLSDLYRALRAQKQDMAERAAQEKKMRGEAEALREEVARLRAEMIETADRLQGHEDKVTKLEARLKDLLARDAELRRKLAENEASAARTLAALERLAVRPPEAIIGRPVDSAVDTIRTAMLLSAVVPAVQTDAAGLRAQIEALRISRNRIEQDREALSLANRNLAAERTKLAALVEAKQRQEADARAGAEREAKRSRALSAKADDLADLIQSLEKDAARQRAEAKARAAAEAKAAAEAARERARRERETARGPSLAHLVPPPKPAPAPAPAERPVPEGGAFAGGKGVRMPASGEIVRRFGQKDAYGTRARGVTIATRPGATVTAPVAGKVVFAGPFRDYGQLLIISPAAGYHVLLAGLSRIDAVGGQFLLMGEPVGQMASGPGLTSDEPAGTVAVRSASTKLRLYMEFRKNGEPVDPAPWLASGERKVSR